MNRKTLLKHLYPAIVIIVVITAVTLIDSNFGNCRPKYGPDNNILETTALDEFDGEGFGEWKIYDVNQYFHFDDNVKIYGSWMDTDSSTGSMATRWYKTKKSGKITIAVFGSPNKPNVNSDENNELFALIKDKAGGISKIGCELQGHFLQAALWRIPVGPNASEFRIVAVDNTVGNGGWLGFSEPITVQRDYDPANANPLNFGPYSDWIVFWLDYQENAVMFFYALSLVLVALMVISIFMCEERKYMVKVFMFCSFVAIIVFRGLSLYADSYNVDEGLYITVAKTLFTDMRPWVSSHSGTVGPICQFVIIFFYMFLKIFIPTIGFSYFLLRAVSIFLILGTFVLLSKIFARRLNTKLALSILLFYVLFFSFSWFFDIQAFNSEFVYMFLVTVCLYCIYRFKDGLSLVPVITGGLVCGSMPFLKLQTGPMCVAIALWTFYLVAVKKEPMKILSAEVSKLGAFIIYSATLVLPTLFFVVWCLSYGGLSNAWHYYYAWAMQDHIGSYPTSFYVMFFTAHLFPHFLRTPWVGNVFWLMIATALLMVRFFGGRVKANAPWLFSCLLALSALIAIIRPVRLFHHYIVFLVVPLLVLFMETVAAISKSEDFKICLPKLPMPARISEKIMILYKKYTKGFSRERVIATLIVLLFIFLFRSFPKNVLTETILTNKVVAGTAQPQFTELAKYVVKHTAPDDFIVLWGQEQRTAVFSDRKCGMGISGSLWGTPSNPDYHDELWLAYVRPKNPKLIVDIVAPGSFGFWDENLQSLEKHKLWQTLRNDYTLAQIMPVNGGSFKVYRRNH